MKKKLTTENTRIVITDNGVEIQVKQVRLLGGQPHGELKEKSDLRTIIALWDENQAWKRNENKIKADAVREAAVYLESQTVTSKTDHYLLNEYADKLERGSN